MSKLFEAEYGICKFVCVGHEDYRFADMYTDHSSLVKAGETATSAGFVQWNDGTCRVPPESSMTLRMGPNVERDAPKIASLIGMKEYGHG